MNTRIPESFAGLLPPKIISVHSRPLIFSGTFADIANRFASLEGTVALMSGGTLDCARYNILGIKPLLSFTSKGSTCVLNTAANQASADFDPFMLLDHIVEHYHLALPDLPAPLCTGILGYLSYDLKEHLEELPRTSIDDLHLPSLYMTLPSLTIVEDRLENHTTIHIPILSGEKLTAAEKRLTRFEEMLSEKPEHDHFNNSNTSNTLRSAFTRQAYMDAVEKIRRYIIDGDVYQVNMSQRFQSPFQDNPFTCYRTMFEENPAPFFAYINAGDHQILSTSPERLILLYGRDVETRPIKGTRRRGSDDADDASQKNDLVKSPKDDAELSMIVDLLRNDIGKVCSTDTVTVTAHKRVEAYENVYHMVSIVKGLLDEDKSAVDLIRATFPGGSITGCPKIRAMEIIDELEPVRRHIYTGSIGYISFHDTMDLSIAIRTATVNGGQIYFSVGGGIVYDSQPADEYEETLHKGRTLMRSINHQNNSPGKPQSHIVWQNGIFKPAEKAVVSCSDEGFLFGYGFFETIRIENGRPCMLNAHLERFHTAWHSFFGTPPPDITWGDVINHLCKRNKLMSTTAACKILAAAGKPGTPQPGILLVTIREYRHRLEDNEHAGLRLIVYPHPRQSPLASHKTMNYMLYKQAGSYAQSNKGDEAIILNPDNTVSETNTGNIFCLSGNRVRIPISEHALRGTVLSAMHEKLAGLGYHEELVALTVNDLLNSDAVFVSNALIGVVPVISIDGTGISRDDAFVDNINSALFGHPLYPAAGTI